jgi:hypothetical protein
MPKPACVVFFPIEIPRSSDPLIHAVDIVNAPIPSLYKKYKTRKIVTSRNVELQQGENASF